MKDTTWADLLAYLIKIDRERDLRSEYVIAAPWVDFGSFAGKELFGQGTKRVCAWWNPGANEAYYVHIALQAIAAADIRKLGNDHSQTMIIAKFEDVRNAERFTSMATRFIFGLPEGEVS